MSASHGNAKAGTRLPVDFGSSVFQGAARAALPGDRPAAKFKVASATPGFTWHGSAPRCQGGRHQMTFTNFSTGRGHSFTAAVPGVEARQAHCRDRRVRRPQSAGCNGDLHHVHESLHVGTEVKIVQENIHHTNSDGGLLPRLARSRSDSGQTRGGRIPRHEIWAAKNMAKRFVSTVSFKAKLHPCVGRR